MVSNIQLIEKPDWVSWDEIHEVLWKAHAENRKKGINMAFPALPGEKIHENLEKNHGKMFVALDENNKVIATAAIKVKKANLWCGKGSYAYLCFASILPEYRGHGIYKSLYIYIEREGLKMGLNRILFDTHEHNQRMIDINSQHGFVPVDISVWKDHYNIVMVKWLNGCPYSDWFCKLQFLAHKCYRKLRFKPGKVKRFGI